MTEQTEQPTYLTNEFTAQWTKQYQPCPKCSSSMIWIRRIIPGRNDTCPICGTPLKIKVKETMPMSKDILNPTPQERKPKNVHKIPYNCEFTNDDGSRCGVTFMRIRGGDRRYCDAHAKIMKSRNGSARRKARGIPNFTQSSQEYECFGCHKPILPRRQMIKVKGQEERYHYACFIKGIEKEGRE